MKKSWQERLAEQESTNKVSIEPALEGLLDNLGREEQLIIKMKERKLLSAPYYSLITMSLTYVCRGESH